MGVNLKEVNRAALLCFVGMLFGVWLACFEPNAPFVASEGPFLALLR